MFSAGDWHICRDFRSYHINQIVHGGQCLWENGTKGASEGFFRDGKRKVDLQLKQLADSGRPLDISLTNDFAFKKTFRNKIALTGLLSSLLDIPAGEITSLEFPDTFLHGEYAEDREGIHGCKGAPQPL